MHGGSNNSSCVGAIVNKGINNILNISGMMTHPLKSRGNTPSAHLIRGSFAGWSPDFHDLLTEQLGEEGTEPRVELRRSLLLASDAKPTIASRWRHRLVCVSEPTAIGGNINT